MVTSHYVPLLVRSRQTSISTLQQLPEGGIFFYFSKEAKVVPWPPPTFWTTTCVNSLLQGKKKGRSRLLLVCSSLGATQGLAGLLSILFDPRTNTSDCGVGRLEAYGAEDCGIPVTTSEASGVQAFEDRRLGAH
jgi:hypothetical protein